MDMHFFCRECGSEHTEPADARLGHHVICLDCEVLVAPAEVAAARVGAIIPLGRPVIADSGRTTCAA